MRLALSVVRIAFGPRIIADNHKKVLHFGHLKLPNEFHPFKRGQRQLILHRTQTKANKFHSANSSRSNRSFIISTLDDRAMRVCFAFLSVNLMHAIANSIDAITSLCAATVCEVSAVWNVSFVPANQILACVRCAFIASISFLVPLLIFPSLFVFNGFLAIYFNSLFSLASQGTSEQSVNMCTPYFL